MKVIILGSGSKGNSTLLISNNTKILIDVGFSYPQMTEMLKQYDVVPHDIDAILLTHTHSDHTKGLKTFVSKNDLKIYTNEIMLQEVVKIVDEGDTIIRDNDFSIGDFTIKVIHTSHDAIGSVGFIISDNNSDLVYVTDTGYINKSNLELMHNKNLYILESNHDIEMLMTGPYPYILKQRVVSDKGHLSNETAGTYLKELIGDRTKKIVLAHLSEINNTPEIALKTVGDILKTNICILAAPQYECLDLGDICD